MSLTWIEKENTKISVIRCIIRQLLLLNDSLRRSVKNVPHRSLWESPTQNSIQNSLPSNSRCFFYCQFSSSNYYYSVWFRMFRSILEVCRYVQNGYNTVMFRTAQPIVFGDCWLAKFCLLSVLFFNLLRKPFNSFFNSIY